MTTPVYDWIRFHAEGQPDKLAAVDVESGRRLTYAAARRARDAAGARLVGKIRHQEGRPRRGAGAELDRPDGGAVRGAETRLHLLAAELAARGAGARIHLPRQHACAAGVSCQHARHGARVGQTRGHSGDTRNDRWRRECLRAADRPIAAHATPLARPHPRRCLVDHLHIGNDGAAQGRAADARADVLQRGASAPCIWRCRRRPSA